MIFSTVPENENPGVGFAVIIQDPLGAFSSVWMKHIGTPQVGACATVCRIRSPPKTHLAGNYNSFFSGPILANFIFLS